MTSPETSAIHPDTITEAFLPPPALRDGLICVLHRDTRGCELTPLQSFTYGSATTNMTLTWYWQGQPESLSTWAPDDLEAHRSAVPGPVRISGGTTRPWIGYSKEPCHMLVAVFRPDAMRQWFGLDPIAWTDRAAALADIGDVPWASWARAIHAAADVDTALPLLYAGLLADRGDAGADHDRPKSTGQWLNELMSRTGLEAGSPRTAQRMIRRQVGVSSRKTKKLARLESLAVGIGEQILAGQRPLRLASLAENSDYYDHAQLARDMREIVGFTPTEAIRRTISDESFWIVRAFYSVYLGSDDAPRRRSG